ncbi:MAG: hypothetical protein WAT58_11905 [Candidatus Dormiibacterota bacterium]
MTKTRNLITAAGIAASLLTGGVVGAVVLGPLTASAATASPTPAATTSPGSGSSTAPSGTFKPNEDPTHEQGESAAREAQEDAGQMPTVP